MDHTMFEDEESSSASITTNQESSSDLGTSSQDDEASESKLPPLGRSLLHGIPVSLSDKISQLLTEDQLAAMQDLFQTHLVIPFGNPELPMKGCPLFEKIPIECRKQIWEYLLCNPLLGECYAINEHRAFGLHPELIRVNKQSYDEGMDILYGSNTFLIECTPHNCSSLGARGVSSCALARYQQRDQHPRQKRDEKIIPAAKHVQHWKVVVSGLVSNLSMENGLASLCRSIATSNIRSLEVLIIPRDIEGDEDQEGIYGDESQLAIILSPFERLRNIERFTIRSAEFHEIPEVAYAQGDWLADEFLPILPDPVDEVRLVTLIEGDSQVENIERMYKTLVAYAQTFERIEEFKDGMDIDDEDSTTDYLEDPNYHSNHYTPKNLFIFSRHPVEVALKSAKLAMIQDMMEDFKLNRSIAIRYLEPQYQRIEIASKNLVDFVKEQKVHFGILDPEGLLSSPSIDVLTEAMILLEDYEASFERQLDTATRLSIRKQKHILGALYDILPLERIMKVCRIAFEKQWWARFLWHFKQAVDEMDSQYLSIRKARKSLYVSDLLSTTREVDTNSMLCDEVICWNVRERDMRVRMEGDKYEYIGYHTDQYSNDEPESIESLQHRNDNDAGSDGGSIDSELSETDGQGDDVASNGEDDGSGALDAEENSNSE